MLNDMPHERARGGLPASLRSMRWGWLVFAVLHSGAALLQLVGLAVRGLPGGDGIESYWPLLALAVVEAAIISDAEGRPVEVAELLADA